MDEDKADASKAFKRYDAAAHMKEWIDRCESAACAPVLTSLDIAAAESAFVAKQRAEARAEIDELIKMQDEHPEMRDPGRYTAVLGVRVNPEGLMTPLERMATFRGETIKYKKYDWVVSHKYNGRTGRYESIYIIAFVKVDQWVGSVACSSQCIGPWVLSDVAAFLEDVKDVTSHGDLSLFLIRDYN
jgi:hypothetical protein